MSVGAMFLMAAKPPSGPILVVVTNVAAFQFGSLSSGDLSGTVALNASSGAKTVSGGVVDMGGTHTSASFEITGDKGVAVTLTLPAAITVNGPTGTMTIDALTHDCADPCLIPNSGGGKLTVNIGGTLHVGSGQPSGSYTGNFDLTADYVTNPQGGANITDAASVSATNIQAISISGNSSIDFGTFYAPTSGSGGSVIIAPDGTRSSPQGKVTLAGGSPSAASFSVGGSPNTAYTVTVSSPGTLTNGSGASMAIGSFTHDNTDDALPASGSETINIGASLTVPKNQASGTYTGTFTVTVDYQ
jgi:hypothetical protein